MATGIYSWSQTAANNSTADSTINWAEGQAPSTVNDSSRAEMAVVAKWRDDISGVRPSNVVQTSGGTANAQTLTTNGSIAALTNGWTLTFKAGASNTGACTLAVDGLTAKNIQRVSGTNLIGGEIINGCVYTVTYHQPADTWVLHSKPPISGMELLTYGTVSSAATLSIVLTSYTAYRAIKFILTGFQPVTDDAVLWIRTSSDGGSNYNAGASDYDYAYIYLGASANPAGVRSLASTAMVTGPVGVGSAATECGNFEVTLYNQAATAFHTQVSWIGSYKTSDGTPTNPSGAGSRLNNGDVDAIRFLFSSGNIDEGKYAVYGLV